MGQIVHIPEVSHRPLAEGTAMNASAQSQAGFATGSARTRILVPGLVAAVVAAAATTLVAIADGAVGVDFEVPDNGQSIPLSAFPASAFLLSTLGVAGAVLIYRWSRNPAPTFVRVALTLTLLSLTPPVFTGANAATSLSLILAHLVAAAIVIPVLASTVRERSR